jgi:hypothetical protein
MGRCGLLIKVVEIDTYGLLRSDSGNTAPESVRMVQQSVTLLP